MIKILTLGPKGTYSEIACQKIIEKLDNKAVIRYEPSIDLCFNTFKEDILVLPLENSIDGFVQRTLDLLVKYDNYFISSIERVDVTFSFVTNEVSIDSVDEVYVQYKALQQCLSFLSKFKHLKFIQTESNTESLEKLMENPDKRAAIIPHHLVNFPFELTIHHIEDINPNQTRFACIEKTLHIRNSNNALIVITPNDDRPGLLYDLLHIFKEHNINLKSIISRPIIDKIGLHHFFLELDINHKNIQEIINYFMSIYDVKIRLLGVY